MITGDDEVELNWRGVSTTIDEEPLEGYMVCITWHHLTASHNQEIEFVNFKFRLIHKSMHIFLVKGGISGEGDWVVRLTHRPIAYICC